MRINKKDEQIKKYEKINFDSCSKQIDETPMKNIKTPNDVKKSILMDIQNNLFGKTPFTSRDIILSPNTEIPLEQ